MRKETIAQKKARSPRRDDRSSSAREASHDAAPDVADEVRLPSSATTIEQKKNFQANFRRALKRSGLTIQQLADRTGVDLQTLRRWRREGVAQPEHEHIERIASVFGFANPWSLMEPMETVARPPTDGRSLDRATNPYVDEVLQDRPELFADFLPVDWDELYSLHGTGGPLTYDGVIQAATRINDKRDLRRKFEVVMETHHFQTLAHLVNVLYRETEISPLPNSNDRDR